MSLQSITRLSSLWLLIATLLLLAGCGEQSSNTVSLAANAGGGTAQAQIDKAYSDRQIAPLRLRNPAPGQLEAYFQLTVGGYTDATRTQSALSLAVQSRGQVVQFTGSERLLCNGRALPIHQQPATFQLIEGPSSALAGRVYRCIYSVGTSATTLQVMLPAAPAILSPREHARLPRSVHTPVSYIIPAGKLAGVVALGPRMKTIARPKTPDAGRLTLDTRVFTAGPGSISLTVVLKAVVLETGAAFKVAQAEGQGETSIAVSWL